MSDERAVPERDDCFINAMDERARAESAEAVLDAIEAMLTKKKRMGTLFDVQQIRREQDRR